MRIYIFGLRYSQGSPQKEKGAILTSRGSESANSFRDYWESVNDAWDCGDDEFSSLAGKFSGKATAELM